MKDSIVLVAGGTGGHIWPAISFGQWIEKNRNDYKVHHICGSRRLEAEIHKAAGTKPFVLNMDGSPLSGRNIVQRFSRLFSLFTAFMQARKYLKEVKPVCCVLFAGYISVPVLLACKSLGIYVVLHEQNAHSGRVTRLAVKMGVEIFTGWKECYPLPEDAYTPIGIPVREMKRVKPEEAWKKLGLKGRLPGSPRVAVMTGSLGSSSVKEIIENISTKDSFKGWTFILPAVSESIECINGNVYLLPKTWDVSLVYSLADMLIIRAGASTLSETAEMKIPAMVIPWLKAADNHQSYNAVSFAGENNAIIFNETGNSADFEKKLKELHEIFKKNEENSKTRMYNNIGSIISENFWFALSPKFERRTSIGTE